MERKKNILVLIDTLKQTGSSGIKGRVNLIQNLIKEGVEVTVLYLGKKEFILDGATHYPITELKGLNYLLSRTQRITQRYLKVDCSIFLENLFGFSFTFFNDVKRFQKALKQYHPADFDLVMTLSHGASFRPHYALLQSPQWHSKWLAYIHDPYPFNNYPDAYAFEPKGKRQKNLFADELCSKAHFLGFPSKRLAEWMQRKIAFDTNKISILPHQSSDTLFEALNAPVYFDQTLFSIAHVGNLMAARDPRSLIQAFDLFVKNNPTASSEASLLFIGPNHYWADYLKNNTHEAIVIQPNSPYKEALYVQRFASVQAIIEANDAISPFLPGKFPVAVTANRPLLCVTPHDSELNRLLGTAYPYTFQHEEVEKMADGITRLYTLWKENPKNLRLDRPDLLAYCSSNYLKEEIEALIAKVS